MTPELQARMRAARRRPLFEPDGLPGIEGGASLVHRLIPHRDTMLLVDELLAFDPVAGRILGRVHIASDHPGFAGHFPGDPVYPGALQLEAVGQCGLCLRPLRKSAGAPPARASGPAPVRLLRILGAEFLEPVRPGTDALLLAEVVEDEFTFVALGQMLVGGRPTCVCAFEAMVLEEADADA